MLPEGWPINPVVTHSEKQATEVKPEIDYGPYMVELQRRIKRAWHPTPDVDWGNEGSPTVVFKVHKDGSVSDLNLANSRGKVEASKSLMNAVRDAAPFSPLPTNAPESVDIQFTMNCCPVFSGSGSFRRF